MSRAWAERHGAVEVAPYTDAEIAYVEDHANGTGPFVLEAYEPGARTVLVRNAEWWGLAEDPHNIDRVVFTAIADPARRVAALLAGEIDFLHDPAVRRARPAREHSRRPARADDGVPDHLLRPRSGQPGTPFLERQGQEPLRRSAGAAGGLSGDRRRGDPDRDHARLCHSRGHDHSARNERVHAGVRYPTGLRSGRGQGPAGRGRLPQRLRGAARLPEEPLPQRRGHLPSGGRHAGQRWDYRRSLGRAHGRAHRQAAGAADRLLHARLGRGRRSIPSTTSSISTGATASTMRPATPTRASTS